MMAVIMLLFCYAVVAATDIEINDLNAPGGQQPNQQPLLAANAVQMNNAPVIIKLKSCCETCCCWIDRTLGIVIATTAYTHPVWITFLSLPEVDVLAMGENGVGHALKDYVSAIAVTLWACILGQHGVDSGIDDKTVLVFWLKNILIWVADKYQSGLLMWVMFYTNSFHLLYELIENKYARVLIVSTLVVLLIHLAYFYIFSVF